MTTTIDLSQFADVISQAQVNGFPCALATANTEGDIDIGMKGSMMVFDKEHLAYWERTRGTHLDNLRQAPKVAVLLYSRDPRAYLRLFGIAEIHEDGPIREEIMSRTVQNELDRDPERKGFGVLIKVTSIMMPRATAPQPSQS
jgi:general stress protein 26